MKAAKLAKSPIAINPPHTNSMTPPTQISEPTGGEPPPFALGGHPNSFCVPCIMNMIPTMIRKIA
jgi:hypothetical protein